MVNVPKFKTEFTLEVEKAASEASVAKLQAFLELTYHIIMTDWPKWTYYSMSNNFISVDRPITIPTPSQRPTHRDAMVDDAGIRFAEGLDFIRNLKPLKTHDRVVYISNPVPYANDPSIVDGQAIYENALNIAESVLAASDSN
jgi:hypothetical protein